MSGFARSYTIATRTGRGYTFIVLIYGCTTRCGPSSHGRSLATRRCPSPWPRRWKPAARPRWWQPRTNGIRRQGPRPRVPRAKRWHPARPITCGDSRPPNSDRATRRPATCSPLSPTTTTRGKPGLVADAFTRDQPADRRLLVCFTPRSGSSWPTRIVGATRPLGVLVEYINPAFTRDVAAQMHATDQATLLALLRRCAYGQSGVLDGAAHDRRRAARGWRILCGV